METPVVSAIKRIHTLYSLAIRRSYEKLVLFAGEINYTWAIFQSDVRLPQGKSNVDLPYFFLGFVQTWGIPQSQIQ